MTIFSQQQARLRELSAEVGFSASLRDLSSTLALEFAVLEEQKPRRSKMAQWLEIAAILESRGR